MIYVYREMCVEYVVQRRRKRRRRSGRRMREEARGAGERHASRYDIFI